MGNTSWKCGEEIIQRLLDEISTWQLPEKQNTQETTTRNMPASAMSGGLGQGFWGVLILVGVITVGVVANVTSYVWDKLTGKGKQDPHDNDDDEEPFE